MSAKRKIVADYYGLQWVQVIGVASKLEYSVCDTHGLLPNDS